MAGLVPKLTSTWRILDLLKIQSSPKPSRSPSTTQLQAQGSTNVCKCSCCGSVLVFPDDACKFHCSQCHTTNIVDFTSDVGPHLLSFAYVKQLTDKYMAEEGEMHLRLKPLADYLLEAFGSFQCVNNSFKCKKQSKRAHYSTLNVDLADVRRTFNLLASLPSRRPLYCALMGVCNSLKRLPVALSSEPRDMYWIIVLFEIPFLSRAFTNSDKRSDKKPVSMVEIPEIQALCYEILKRVLGILAQAETTSAGNYIASWFSKLSNQEFMAKVELVNLYITFHLKKYFYFANNPELARRGSLGSIEPSPKAMFRSGSVSQDDQAEFFQYSYLKDEVEEMNLEAPLFSNLQIAMPPPPRKGSTKKKKDIKVRVHQYSQNYHLRTAAGALGILVKANYIRHNHNKISMHAFYNSLVDYVNIKLDFDSWLSRKKLGSHKGTEPALQTVIDYVHGGGALMPFEELPGTLFFFCQYPFLISLGGKIAILEYEARRQMERKAEEAFINTLDRRVALDVYFKVRVRRDYIVQDSLRCIQLNPSNLKKSLKVQFLNEPGVDAGGLRKEWFLILTRALFSAQAGMLSNVEDSNLLWFNIVPVENFEMYYLFGAVLGLAIYNSTILDLKFPVALYKILLGLPIGLADYQEIYPVASSNLFKIRDYSEEELGALDLVFEVSFADQFGKVHQRELVPNGSNIAVTQDNRELYIDKYARFFLSDGIAKQLNSFKNGFTNVVDGNAFSLFLPEEILLLLCGSDETKFDVDVLRSVTQYSGWSSKQEAEDSLLVHWFWEYIENLTFKQQKKVLFFITGSDRVPATGIQNLGLKISRLKNGHDSDRLPVAHTCFNELSIYQYSTKEKMQDKLSKAVNMSAGFGIK